MTNDIYDEPLLKMLLYGNPGCGKTTLVGTASEVESLWPVLYLNAKGNPVVLRENEKRPDVVTIARMKEFNGPYKWITGGQDPKDEFAVEHNLGSEGEYKTLVVDAITEVQRHVVRLIAGGEYIDAGALMPNLGRQGFGQLLGTMLNWADHFIELPMNVILVSHEANKENRVSPLLWGQSGFEICSQVLLVMRLTTGLALPAHVENDIEGTIDFNVAQVLETYPVYAKDQYNMGVKYIVDPTMKKVMDLIEQGS